MTWDMVLAGDYWRGCGSKLHVGDRIFVRHDALKFAGELICTGCVGIKVQVEELWSKQLGGAMDALSFEEASGFRVEDRGLAEKFAIVRIKDGVTVAANIESAALARQQIFSDFVPRAQRRWG